MIIPAMEKKRADRRRKRLLPCRRAGTQKKGAAGILRALVDFEGKGKPRRGMTPGNHREKRLTGWINRYERITALAFCQVPIRSIRIRRNRS